MPKLHQIVAVLNGKKNKCLGEITELHKRCQNGDLFSGSSRTYEPNTDGDEKLPDETKYPQMDAREIIIRCSKLWEDYLDTSLLVDNGSSQARANVVVNGATILANVPVLHLIFLDQQLNDIRKFVATLPVLDPNHDWEFDPDRDWNVTKPTKQNRNIKRKRVITKAEATDKFPAQADIVDVDEWVGVFTSTKFGTGIQGARKREYLDRVDQLIDAVKMAREEANQIEVEQRKEAKRLFDFIFGTAMVMGNKNS